MCILYVAHAQQHTRYRLILAANREEFFSRPTAPLHFWKEDATILAGRDLEANGTWLGICRDGRWAALTNAFRSSSRRNEGPSRGEIVAKWLQTGREEHFMAQLKTNEDDYEGYNVLLGTLGREPRESSLYFFTNQNRFNEPPRSLPPNFYVLSNSTLDTPSQKAVFGKDTMVRLLSELPSSDSLNAEDKLVQDLFTLLRHQNVFCLANSSDYGTRASTLILARRDRSVRYVERSFDRSGSETGTIEHDLQLCKI
jgi:uncharacterized protein with NRDE domain